MIYDLAIIGGGPAGIAAGIYAARKKIKAVLITDYFGGQSIVAKEIQNWLGTKSISGTDLAKNLEEHLRAQEGIEIKQGLVVSKINKDNGGFSLSLENGEEIKSKLILMASGSRRKKLNISGEKELAGKGVAYCSTCDAPLFKNKIAAVIGGGNAGLEAVLDLFPYASKIYLITHADQLKGDQTTLDKIQKADSSKVEIILNAESQAVLGKNSVTGLRYLDKTNNQTKELKLDGVFVEIGLEPTSELVKNLVQLDERGHIMVDCKTQKAAEGIWAAGDVTDVLYRQNNISAGDGIKAILNIYDYLQKN